MTEINRMNYHILIPEVVQKLRQASFVCFDAEFTGLYDEERSPQPSLFDDGFDRYLKQRKIALCNKALQVGFAIFRKVDEKSSEYSVEAYQAYVINGMHLLKMFGDMKVDNTETVLNLNRKSCTFLRKCGFDFSEWSETCVPCTNAADAQEILKKLKTDPNFLRSPAIQSDEIIIPPMSLRQAERTDENIQDIFARIRGFSVLVDVIQELQIPLVMHNATFDLLYFSQLFCGPLPETYDEYKRLINGLVPRVYDTKFMVVNCRKILSSHPVYRDNQDKDKLKQSSLFKAYQNTSGIGDKFSPVLKLESSCETYLTSMEQGRTECLYDALNAPLHHPAFDACVTGALFLNVTHIAARIDKTFQSRLLPPTLSEVFYNIASWQNQVFLPRASTIAMKLDGNDPCPSGPKWILARSQNKIEFATVQKELLGFGSADVEQLGDFSFRYAAAWGKSVQLARKYLMEVGYEVKNLNFPQTRNFAAPGQFRRGGYYNEPGRGRGNYNEPGRGGGYYNGPGRGRGNYNEPGRGRGNYNEPGRGGGYYNGPVRGGGNYNEPGRGRGNYNEPGRGRGNYNGPGRGRGNYNEPGRGRGNYNEPGRGRGNYNEPGPSGGYYNGPGPSVSGGPR